MIFKLVLDDNIRLQIGKCIFKFTHRDTKAGQIGDGAVGDDEARRRKLHRRHGRQPTEPVPNLLKHSKYKVLVNVHVLQILDGHAQLLTIDKNNAQGGFSSSSLKVELWIHQLRMRQMRRNILRSPIRCTLTNNDGLNFLFPSEGNFSSKVIR